jgi:hypothetical protein
MLLMLLIPLLLLLLLRTSKSASHSLAAPAAILFFFLSFPFPSPSFKAAKRDAVDMRALYHTSSTITLYISPRVVPEKGGKRERTMTCARLLTVLLALLAVGRAVAVIPAGQTFCSKYTGAIFGAGTANDAGNQTLLIRAVVTRAALGYNQAPNVFPGVFADVDANPARDVFAGRVQYRPDYDSGVPASFAPAYSSPSVAASDVDALVNRLTLFFGSALGCALSNPAFGAPRLPPRSSTLAQIHGGMGVTQAMMTYFNAQVAGSMLSFGVESDDVIGVALPALLTFGRCAVPYTRTICHGADCALATPAEPGCVVSSVQAADVERARPAVIGFGISLVVLLLFMLLMIGVVICTMMAWKREQSADKNGDTERSKLVIGTSSSSSTAPAAKSFITLSRK